MRVLVACLLGFLGLGALAAMAACSDSIDTGSAGAAGSSGASSAGTGGKTSSAGGTSTAGTGGGSAECAFATDECNSCLLLDHCSAQVSACGNDASCGPALQVLPNCVCDPSKEIDKCQAAFVMAGGAKASQLIECYTLNCEDECQ